MNLRRSLRLGRLAYLFYYRPVGHIRNSWRNGGPLAERETERHRQAMEAAAAALPALPRADRAPPLAVHLLTGRRFWYQTVFCLHSLAAAAEVDIDAHVYDDGSLDDETSARLRHLGPGVQLHLIDELRARRDRYLPTSQFPALRERWENYPNIRKLIDVHLGSTGWKLVLDSDLLFFRRPDELLDWAAAPDVLLHATDCQDSYGYTRPLLESLAGAPLSLRLNVGVCGLRSESLDWDQLETWTAELQFRERTNYYLEQALIAMIAARHPCRALPSQDYLTMPSRQEVLQPTAVMHHYVDTSKRWYFRHGWRHAQAAVANACHH